MYYLYKKSKGVVLPRFDYTFAKFQDFYDVAKVLTASLVGSYNIRIKSVIFKDIIEFINADNAYSWLNIYIEASQDILDKIAMFKPNANFLSTKTNWDTFIELIQRYGVLFDHGCIPVLYKAIPHDYDSMAEALALLIQEYGNKNITRNDIASLFVVDDLIYPRTVCIEYLRMDRWRSTHLQKCLSYFGNDLVLYAIRKNTDAYMKEKVSYLETGSGSSLIKTIPINNIIRLQHALYVGRQRFMDITTILSLYEKGETVYDTVQNRTLSIADEEHYAIG